MLKVSNQRLRSKWHKVPFGSATVSVLYCLTRPRCSCRASPFGMAAPKTHRVQFEDDVKTYHALLSEELMPAICFAAWKVTRDNLQLKTHEIARIVASDRFNRKLTGAMRTDAYPAVVKAMDDVSGWVSVRSHTEFLECGKERVRETVNTIMYIKAYELLCVEEIVKKGEDYDLFITKCVNLYIDRDSQEQTATRARLVQQTLKQRQSDWR